MSFALQSKGFASFDTTSNGSGCRRPAVRFRCAVGRGPFGVGAPAVAASRYPTRSYGTAAKLRQQCLRHARWTPELGSLIGSGARRVAMHGGQCRARARLPPTLCCRTVAGAPTERKGSARAAGVRRQAEATLPQFGNVAIAPEDIRGLARPGTKPWTHTQTHTSPAALIGVTRASPPVAANRATTAAPASAASATPRPAFPTRTGFRSASRTSRA